MPERIPFRVAKLENFMDRVRDDLGSLMEEQRFETIIDTQISTKVANSFETFQEFCQDHQITVLGGRNEKEASVGNFGGALPGPVRAMYFALTGSRVISTPQVSTNDYAVEVDRVYRERPNEEDDSSEGCIHILEEDKALRVFEHHAADLQAKLDGAQTLFPNKDAGSFHGVEAILAKVCDAHALGSLRIAKYSSRGPSFSWFFLFLFTE
jgi:hypothetical protein